MCLINNIYIISGVSSECRAFDENFKGVTCNIINLYTNLKIAEDVAQIARTLIDQLNSDKFGAKNVYYEEAGCQQGFQFTTTAEINDILTRALTCQAWTYENLLERTKSTLIDTPPVKYTPNLEKHGASKIAAVFQVNKIKNKY